MNSTKYKQQKLIQNLHSGSSYGGNLRKKRRGRCARPLSTRNPHHIVFKIVKSNLRNRSFRHPQNFKFVQFLMKRYAEKFYIKIEQITYQHDHIHLIVRSSRRSGFQNFFRVFAGQIAQSLKVTDTPEMSGNGASAAKDEDKKIVLWAGRPFSRIIVGWLNHKTLKNYLVLNELEVTGTLKYQKQRLRGLSNEEWDIVKWNC